MSYSRVVRPTTRTARLSTGAARPSTEDIGGGRVRRSPRKQPYSARAAMQDQWRTAPSQPRPVNAGFSSSSRYGRQGDAMEEEQGGTAAEGAGSSGVNEQQERTMQSRGTHYVLQPNPAKNSQLKQVAASEEESYEHYKQDKRERERAARQLHSEAPRPVGGPRKSHSELEKDRAIQERKQQIEAKLKSVRQKEKRDEYKRKEKEKEEERLREMKATQREKAVKLESRKQERQQEELEHMRRQRLKYLEAKGIR